MKSKLSKLVDWLEEDNAHYAYHPGSWAYRVLEKARALLAAEESKECPYSDDGKCYAPDRKHLKDEKGGK